eukprot:366074-Chlamydomonas_euryale.AAC.18
MGSGPAAACGEALADQNDRPTAGKESHQLQQPATGAIVRCSGIRSDDTLDTAPPHGGPVPPPRLVAARAGTPQSTGNGDGVSALLQSRHWRRHAVKGLRASGRVARRSGGGSEPTQAGGHIRMPWDSDAATSTQLVQAARCAATAQQGVLDIGTGMPFVLSHGEDPLRLFGGRPLSKSEQRVWQILDVMRSDPLRQRASPKRDARRSSTYRSCNGTTPASAAVRAGGATQVRAT